MPDRKPLCRGGRAYRPLATQTRGPLVFGEQLGRRHHPECAAMLRVLRDLVACTPHDDRKAQSQSKGAGQRDSPAALLKVHQWEVCWAIHDAQSRQTALVCNAEDESLVNRELTNYEHR
jgi:hypothetical protein